MQVTIYLPHSHHAVSDLCIIKPIVTSRYRLKKKKKKEVLL